jgi:hypothetical protein
MESSTLEQQGISDKEFQLASHRITDGSRNPFLNYRTGNLKVAFFHDDRQLACDQN